jgi:hypothetical protein
MQEPLAPASRKPVIAAECARERVLRRQRVPRASAQTQRTLLHNRHLDTRAEEDHVTSLKQAGGYKNDSTGLSPMTDLGCQRS